MSSIALSNAGLFNVSKSSIYLIVLLVFLANVHVDVWCLTLGDVVWCLTLGDVLSGVSHWVMSCLVSHRMYFGEHNVKAMFSVLEPLHLRMERGPETLKEISFNHVSFTYMYIYCIVHTHMEF